jgi:hypothetical protein
MSAIWRLVDLYVEALLADPDYHLQVTIADVLTEESIAAVCNLNLHREYDREPHYEGVQVYDRDVQLLRAWLSPPEGRLQ